MRTRKRGIGKTAVILSFLFPAALLLTLAASHAAAQDVPTSTPDGEGFIRVTVQQDDSLWSIAARAGITIPDLLALNNLSEDVVLRPGDTLIVSKVTPPATPTSDIPTPTPQLPTATPTIVKPRTAVCILAYDDLNRDGTYDQAEPLRADVAFTVFDEKSVVSNYITDGRSEPYCLEDLAPGVYHVTRSLLHGETLTTEGDWALNLASGSVLSLAFGSYLEGDTSALTTLDREQQLATRVALEPAATPTPAQPAPAAAGSSRSLWALLALASFVLLLSVAVLTFLFMTRRNAQS